MIQSILLKRFRHPWMPTATFLPVGVLITYLSLHFHPRSLGETLGWILLGLLSWTLVEYVLHRYIFHWVDASERWKAVALAGSRLHTYHHQSSDTSDLIVAPPALTAIFATPLYLAFALLTWSFSAAALVETGLLIGFIVYEWVHFGDHRFLPKTKIGKYLRKYHLQHHFRNPDRQYGITNPFWDIVFGTR